jgi:hypothetical protein
MTRDGLSQKRWRLLLACIGTALPMLATPVRADAIDGDWCSGVGKHMNIRGPRIVTPGGAELQGNYSRHFFSYVIPAGEPGAGSTMAIVLLGEHLAHARTGGPDAPIQEWRRCQPGVS